MNGLSTKHGREHYEESCPLTGHGRMSQYELKWWILPERGETRQHMTWSHQYATLGHTSGIELNRCSVNTINTLLNVGEDWAAIPYVFRKHIPKVRYTYSGCKCDLSVSHWVSNQWSRKSEPCSTRMICRCYCVLSYSEGHRRVLASWGSVSDSEKRLGVQFQT